MHWAAQLGALNTVELLCKAKASVIAEDRFGWMPLHYLCVSETARDNQLENEVITIMKLMIQQKSPRGEEMRIWLVRDTQGRTPLHLAAMNGVTKLVFRTLLELEPNYPLARMRDTNGWNSLHWAVFGGQIGILETLIEAAEITGSNVADNLNEQTAEGWSALHLTAMAVRSGSASKIREILLEERGTKTLLEDKKGRIPLYFAHLQSSNSPRIKGVKDMISSLRGGGAGEAYRKRFSPGKTAFNEIKRRREAYLMRSKVLTFPRDPASVPGCSWTYKECLTRLQTIIQQKQLEPIFTAIHSDLSVVLFPYASSFSTLPLAVKALPTSPLTPPIPNELVVDLGALTLYDHAVVIDDSSSMGFAHGGSRRESVLCVLRNISVINQFLNSPRGRELKTLCFSSAPKANGRLNSSGGFDGWVNSHNFGGHSRVGTGVWEAVVKPLLEDWKIQRPMVVMILTDGQIDPVEADILERAMLRATRKMRDLRASGAILFQFVNFGSPAGGYGANKSSEQQVLEMFINHPELGRVVDVLNWETDQWDVAETQLVKIFRDEDGRSPTQSKAAVEKMGRMLLGR
ncbi:ankyrin repeat-containing domain protein [Terfezia claveryi]|nr:ankyrin repeat-containing domain protein [Terfezia claveryi]